MRAAVDQVLGRRGRVGARGELLAVLSENQLDDEIARGHLVAPFPRAYCRPWDADTESVLARAALVSVGAPAALSHLTGLRRWNLTVPEDGRIHVLVPWRRHPNCANPQLQVHRTRTPTPVVELDGLATVTAAAAVVQSWPLLRSSTAAADRRGPAIEAVRRGLAAPDDLRAQHSLAIGMTGRAELGHLIELLAAGCESELEIWGHLEVFDVPGLRHGTRQLRVTARGHAYRIDLGFLSELVAVEMDGERWHSTREQRERDRRRDAALASVGWVTLRFSHDRLHQDPNGCRADVLAALAARRAWRRSG